MKRQSDSDCACTSGLSYADCCEPLHAGKAASSALALMRSRYVAYVRRDAAYLLASWQADHRPTSLSLVDDPTHWLGLRIVRCEAVDADRATVEFIARYRIGGGSAQRLHEHSRFVRNDGRWYYVDGDLVAG